MGEARFQDAALYGLGIHFNDDYWMAVRAQGFQGGA